MITGEFVGFLDDGVGVVKYYDLVATDGTDARFQLA